MRTAPSIKRAFTRSYSDTGQMKAYVECSDGARTEGEAKFPCDAVGMNMRALFDHARREGVHIQHERW